MASRRRAARRAIDIDFDRESSRSQALVQRGARLLADVGTRSASRLLRSGMGARESRAATGAVRPTRMSLALLWDLTAVGKSEEVIRDGEEEGRQEEGHEEGREEEEVATPFGPGTSLGIGWQRTVGQSPISRHRE